MRTFFLTTALASTAIAGVLVWNAQAQSWHSGGAALKTESQNFTPIEKAACHGRGPRCGWGWTWYCGPRGWCRCVRC
jgi:hypothetical protein